MIINSQQVDSKEKKKEHNSEKKKTYNRDNKINNPEPFQFGLADPNAGPQHFNTTPFGFMSGPLPMAA